MSLTYVATGEVTSLEHELRDHAVELAAGVAEALLAGAEGTEVLDGAGHDIIEELEVDAAGAGCRSEGDLSVDIDGNDDDDGEDEDGSSLRSVSSGRKTITYGRCCCRC